jgi:hypothetical protein
MHSRFADIGMSLLIRLPGEGPDLRPTPLLVQVAFLKTATRRVLPLMSLAMGTVANEPHAIVTRAVRLPHDT